jgi:hypothetical protein
MDNFTNSILLGGMVVSLYLDRTEAETLKKELASAGIVALLREHGPTRFLWGGIFFQVQVQRKDYENARLISAKFDETLQEQRTQRDLLLAAQCPQCGSKDIRINEKKTLVQRLFYAGVTIRLCGECGAQWYT